ncbi:MAG TPA: hypothetical protein DD979_17785 [Gammaproteobacteria bacterium]|nr:hypothetical protein [Gammaproteobacteria bacterium]
MSRHNPAPHVYMASKEDAKANLRPNGTLPGGLISRRNGRTAVPDQPRGVYRSAQASRAHSEPINNHWVSIQAMI